MNVHSIRAYGHPNLTLEVVQAAFPTADVGVDAGHPERLIEAVVEVDGIVARIARGYAGMWAIDRRCRAWRSFPLKEAGGHINEALQKAMVAG
jgi:hypothetical protein